MLARGHLPYFHVYGRIMFAPYNGIPRCSGRCLHRPAPQAGARPSGPMTSIGPYSKDVEEFRPRRGQSGKREKSVKKNAALLHFLGFFPLTLLFGVPRGGACPLGRGCGVAQRSKPQWGFEPHERASSAGWRPSFWPPSALPRNSETFSLPFWSQKGRPKNSMLLYRKRDRMVVPLEGCY